jgi:hypothetical protein
MSRKPMGIRASFATVAFKKDGEELFTATATSGGCFGPVPELKVINEAYAQLRDAIDEGKAKTAALDFNEIAITNEGGRTRSYSVGDHDVKRIDAKALKRITP